MADSQRGVQFGHLRFEAGDAAGEPFAPARWRSCHERERVGRAGDVHREGRFAADLDVQVRARHAARGARQPDLLASADRLPGVHVGPAEVREEHVPRRPGDIDAHSGAEAAIVHEVDHVAAHWCHDGRAHGAADIEPAMAALGVGPAGFGEAAGDRPGRGRPVRPGEVSHGTPPGSSSRVRRGRRRA